jgi:hypothetical protein
MRIKTIALLSATVLLAGCLGSSEPVNVSYTPVQKPTLILPTIDQFGGRKVEWIVVTEENFKEVIEQLRKDGKALALFALTEDGYEELSVNTANLRKLVEQQQAIIAAYERYYEEVEDAIDNTNSINGQ